MKPVLRTLLGEIRTFHAAAIATTAHIALSIPEAGLDAKPHWVTLLNPRLLPNSSVCMKS